MFRTCLAFAFVLSLATAAFPQTNAEKVSKPAVAPVQPPRPNPKDTTQIPDSVKSTVTNAIDEAQAPAPATGLDSAKAAAASDSSFGPDTSAASKASSVMVPESKPSRPDVADLRLFNDPPLIAKEYGFGILGSVVAGALGFYIGSGIETAIVGESKAHKGTLTFTGIRYDNFKGAFWGGASGMVLGSALTTYFVGQTDEENGGFFATLAGTAAAAGGALYVAHLIGVNDDIDWKPFVPLLAIPSLGGTLGFNLSRWFSDRKRESVVSGQASVYLHPPRLGWSPGPDGDRLEISALNMTF